MPHHPHDIAAESAAPPLVALLISTILAVIKGFAGVLGNSYALLADAIESILDVASSLIVWGGLKIAAIPADKDHPYGHGKAEPLAAMLVAIVLAAAAVGIGIQSVREIRTPQHAPARFTLLILVLVVAVKELLFRYLDRAANKVGSTALKTDAWHHRSDALTSMAAFVGISIALIGGPGYASADDWAALFAAFVIVFNAIRLFQPALAEVMDAAPDQAIEATVRAAAQSVESVEGLHRCTVRKMGLNYFVDIDIQVAGEMSVRTGHRLAHAVKDAIRRAEPRIINAMVHVEPTDESGRSHSDPSQSSP